MKKTVLRDMLITGTIVTSVIIVFLIWAILHIRHIEKRIYPDGNTQPLLTVGQANKRFSQKRWASTRYDGYIIDADGITQDVTWVDAFDNKTKVSYRKSHDVLRGIVAFPTEEWVDTDKYFLYYYDVKKLSQKIHRLEALLEDLRIK